MLTMPTKCGARMNGMVIYQVVSLGHWGCSILTHADFGSFEFEVMVVNDVYIVWEAKEPGMDKNV